MCHLLHFHFKERVESTFLSSSSNYCMKKWKKTCKRMLEMLVEKEVTLRSIPLKPQLSPPSIRQPEPSLLESGELPGWVWAASQDDPFHPALPSQQSLSPTIHTEKSWDYFFSLHFVRSCVATDSTAVSSLSQTSAAACLSLKTLYCGAVPVTAFLQIFSESSTSVSSWAVQRRVFQVKLSTHWVKGNNKWPAGCSPPNVCVQRSLLLSEHTLELSSS